MIRTHLGYLAYEQDVIYFIDGDEDAKALDCAWSAYGLQDTQY